MAFIYSRLHSLPQNEVIQEIYQILTKFKCLGEHRRTSLN